MNPDWLKLGRSINNEDKTSNGFKKLLVSILSFVLSILKWVAFSNVAIYVATRIINFWNDPYMEEYNISGYYRDELFAMFTQACLFLITFGFIVSLYKLLFMRNYKWQTWVVFISTGSLVIYGVFS